MVWGEKVTEGKEAALWDNDMWARRNGSCRDLGEEPAKRSSSKCKGPGAGISLAHSGSPRSTPWQERSEQGSECPEGGPACTWGSAQPLTCWVNLGASLLLFGLAHVPIWEMGPLICTATSLTPSAAVRAPRRKVWAEMCMASQWKPGPWIERAVFVSKPCIDYFILLKIWEKHLI